MSAAEDPRSGNRRVDPKSQKSSAGLRDGMAGTQQNRRGGKATLSLEEKSLNGFDSAEVLAVLKAGVDLKAPVYKPDARATAPKGGSPWGPKPGAMANGKDFWVELRRQTAALQGKVTSYGALAKALNSSPRAVGGALRSNPWAPEVPCHRVIASDGFVGGFKGDWQNAPSGVNQSLKLKLLKEEGVNFTGDGRLITTRTVWFDGPWDTTETSKQIAARSSL
ncbi:hypothetical protein DV738_g453, partial [Chaetothyriales sp. CBS 135597]